MLLYPERFSRGMLPRHGLCLDTEGVLQVDHLDYYKLGVLMSTQMPFSVVSVKRRLYCSLHSMTA